LGTWAITVIGTMIQRAHGEHPPAGSHAAHADLSDLVPALLGAMQLSMQLMAGNPIGPENVSWLKMLIGFDVIYTAVSLVLVETVLVG
jgi:heme exporter protein B